LKVARTSEKTLFACGVSCYGHTVIFTNMILVTCEVCVNISVRTDIFLFVSNALGSTISSYLENLLWGNWGVATWCEIILFS